MSKKLLVPTTLLLLAAIWLSGCVTPPRPTTATIQVVTSFYPLYYFAQEIGGNKATVTNITPPGTEPHDYELTPQNVAAIQDSDLLILNGGQFEPWADDVTSQLSTDTIVILAGQEIIVSAQADNDIIPLDPHIWLSPQLASQEVKKITLGFIQADEANSAYYLANQNQLLQKLTDLDLAYQAGLAQCQSRNFVTTHAAFSYLAKDYNLVPSPIAGLSPDEEPSPAQLAETIQFVKDQKIQYIFFESLVSPKLAETIATETGAQTLVLNPLEGLTAEEIQAGATYFTVMQDNLNNLRIALQCQ